MTTEDFFNQTKDSTWFTHDFLPTLPKAKENKIKTNIEFHYGDEGNNDHITAMIDCNLSINYCLQLKGEYNEYRHFGYNKGGYTFGNYQIYDFVQLVKDINKYGIKSPIFILVYPDNEPKISEGNHRIQIAKFLNIKTIPCEIRFFGKAEDSFIEPDKRNPELSQLLNRK